MAEKRKCTGSICVKTSAKTTIKIELFTAEQWSETAQESAALVGRFRLRINRRWHDLPEGGPAYLDMQQIGALVAELTSGGSRVSVPNGRVLAGETMYDGSLTHTEPIRGYDGRWYTNVILMGRGSIMVPVDTLKVHKGR